MVPLTGGVHGALGDLLDVLEELGLGGARVAQEQHVDVAAQAVRPRRVLLLAAEQRQRDAGLDVQVPVDGRRDGLADPLACAGSRSWESLGLAPRGCETHNVLGAACSRPRKLSGFKLSSTSWQSPDSLQCRSNFK